MEKFPYMKLLKTDVLPISNSKRENTLASKTQLDFLRGTPRQESLHIEIYPLNDRQLALHTLHTLTTRCCL